MSKLISIVVPVYNEQECVPVMAAAIRNVMATIDYNYQLIFVDDGSIDNSLEIIRKLKPDHPQVQWISFSRNFGHQNALKAGLDHATGDCVISLDADLQHPPELIPEMIQRWEDGFDVVYTVRKDHVELPMVKRKTSDIFYYILNNLSDMELEQGTADFRLLDQKVVSILRNFSETDIFYRGLIKWVGFKQVGIEYEAGVRKGGRSKYTLRKMVRFALQGITSFSTRPLYIATYLGLTFSLLSLLYIPYIIYSFFHGHPISGWASLIATISFFGGLQLMILGVIGLYLGKMFIQSKSRPHYIIKESEFS